MQRQSRERWRQIVHRRYGKLPFDVSTHGRIRRGSTGNIQTLYPNPRTGYMQFHYQRLRNGRRLCSSINVHPCVCRAFKRPRGENETIEHWNQDKRDNRNANLRYVPLSRNVQRHYDTKGWSPREKWVQYTQAAHDLICRLWATSKWSQVKIAKACGISNGSVCRIVGRKGGVSRYAHTDIDPDWSVLAGTDDPVEQARLIMELTS